MNPFWLLWCSNSVVFLLCQVKQTPTNWSLLQRTLLGDCNTRSTVCFVYTILHDSIIVLERTIFQLSAQRERRGATFSTLWPLELILTVTLRLILGTKRVPVKQFESIWSWNEFVESPRPLPFLFQGEKGCQCSTANRWTRLECRKWISDGRWTWPINEVRGSERGRLAFGEQCQCCIWLSRLNAW